MDFLAVGSTLVSSGETCFILEKLESFTEYNRVDQRIETSYVDLGAFLISNGINPVDDME